MKIRDPCSRYVWTWSPEQSSRESWESACHGNFRLFSFNNPSPALFLSLSSPPFSTFRRVWIARSSHLKHGLRIVNTIPFSFFLFFFLFFFRLGAISESSLRSLLRVDRFDFTICNRTLIVEWFCVSLWLYSFGECVVEIYVKRVFLVSWIKSLLHILWIAPFSPISSNIKICQCVFDVRRFPRRKTSLYQHIFHFLLCFLINWNSELFLERVY